MDSKSNRGALLKLSDLRETGVNLNRPECVLSTAAGDLYVSDKAGGIRHILPNGDARLIGAQAGLIPNGVALLRDGSFAVANLADDGGVWRVQRDGAAEPHIMEIEGVTLPSVNFVWLDDRERLWICVSTVRRGDHQFRRDIADGFIAVRDQRGTRVVAQDVHWTNECRTDPSGMYLYVNETFGRRLLRFRIGADGNLSERTVITEFGKGTYPDGMAVDVEGHIWVVSVVSNRVIRVSPNGEQQLVLEDCDAAHIDRLEAEYLANRLSRPMVYDNHSKRLQNITSLAFGGPERKTAYMGCINGSRLAVFDSPVAGLKPVHWNW
ncbi:SMP-30/gluconolactonase/LRE family protein [Achromobacter insolitus]|uniref:SMP-30/gluconolactonase/LRE family protein n=1 Tax=Achromobacter insolitus TaxID=217204 RepID=UPI00244ED960|nr:SMP-30/gluconolactonase/LRE family protein [Achromobacter insolitus]MDH3063437.1 SMP-30/gluconolactonase/LRE family protein [Achromobacter insolitus]